MSGSSRRALPPTTEQREEAVRVIDAAMTDGQLTYDEHRERLAKVLGAGEAREVERQLLDLQRPAPPPPSPGDRVGGWRSSLRGPLERTWGGLSRKARFAVVAWLGLVVGGIPLLAAVEPGVDESGTAGVAVDGGAEVADGFADVVAAYRDEFGTTLTGEVRYQAGGEHGDHHSGTALVPLEGERARYERWVIVGADFSEGLGRSSGSPSVDLAELDQARIEANAERAWGGLGVEQPSQMTILVRAEDGSPVVTYIVANEFRESGQLTTDAAGTVLRSSPFEAPAH